MVDQASRPRSVTKYAIAGGIAAVALAGVLIALAYMTQPPQAKQESSTTAGNVPQGATPGAGQDNPGPGDGGGAADTNPKPVPHVTPTAAITASPDPVKANTINVAGSGFNGTQIITLTLNGASVKIDPLQLKTSDAGDFSAKLTLPDGQTGNLTLFAVDESGKKASTTLTLK